MPRTGLLIVLAIVIVGALAGLLYSLGYLGNSAPPSETTQTSLASSNEAAPTGNSDSKWIEYMTNVLAEGGLVATFGEANIQNWRIAEGHKLERFSLEGAKAAFGRLSSSVERQNTSETWPERGLSFAFPVEWSNNNKGASIEVGIVARRPSSNGSEILNIVFSTQQAGHSGWQMIGLSGNFELRTFQYVLPNIAEDYTNPPVVVIHADDTAQGKAVEILGVYVKRLK